jgi:hypothetical protein
MARAMTDCYTQREREVNRIVLACLLYISLLRFPLTLPVPRQIIGEHSNGSEQSRQIEYHQTAPAVYRQCGVFILEVGLFRRLNRSRFPRMDYGFGSVFRIKCKKSII